MIFESRYKDQPAVTLESAALRAQFLPGIGGKLASLVFKPQQFDALIHRDGERHVHVVREQVQSHVREDFHDRFVAEARSRRKLDRGDDGAVNRFYITRNVYFFFVSYHIKG